MNTDKYQRNLVVLVVDKSMDYSIRGILHRHQSLGIEQIDFETYQHPYRDSGCLTEGVDFIRPFSKKFQHALIMLDRDGCGKENLTRIKIEEEIEECLSSSVFSKIAETVSLKRCQDPAFLK